MAAYGIRRRQDFSPSCPSGGQWYACESGSKFVGCCGNQPCEDGCKAGNLQPASFDKSFFGKFPDMGCDAGKFWTCNATTPPFLGCCKIDPCKANGCPSESLAGAHLLDNEGLACKYYSSGCQSTSSLTSSSSTSSRSSPAAATSSTSLPNASAVDSRPSRGPIIGGAVGGAAALVVFCVLVFLSYKHAARSRRHRKAAPGEPDSMQNVRERRHLLGLFNRGTGMLDIPIRIDIKQLSASI